MLKKFLYVGLSLFFWSKPSFAFNDFSHGFAVFAEKIHPNLIVKGCNKCHGVDQYPLHSQTDVKLAYTSSKALYSLNFPEESVLWKRSFDGHCGLNKVCGEDKKDPEYLNSIKTWVEAERADLEEEKGESTSVTKFDFPPVGEAIWASVMGPKNERFRIAVRRLGETVLMFSNPTIDQLSMNLAIEGLVVQSPELELKSQNFIEMKRLMKPTEKELTITDQGYVMALIPDANLKSAQINMKLRTYQFGLSIDELKKLKSLGYKPVSAQAILMPKVSKIVSGDSHTCVLFENMRVKCWGVSAYGQLGLGGTNQKGDDETDMGAALPYLEFGSNDQVIDLFGGGGNHTCVLFKSQQIKCWGDNYYGQLGLGDSNYRGDVPGEMGNNLPFVNLGTNMLVKSLALGADHTCALLMNNKVKCWGENSAGQLGLGIIGNRGKNPSETGDGLPFVDLGTTEIIKALFAGKTNSCALFENGKVKCWGSNSYGQLGLGDTNHRGDEANEMGVNLPFIDLGKKESVLGLAVGNHMCALFSDQTIKCWGNNNIGQLGLGDIKLRGDKAGQMGAALPYVNMVGDAPLKSIMSGMSHTCVLFEDGKTKCWGANGQGQLGLGDMDDRGSNPNDMGKFLPAVDQGKNNVPKQISLGSESSCILNISGRIKCWGDNNNGQLGLGDANSRGSQPNEMGESLPYPDIGQYEDFRSSPLMNLKY